MPRYAGPLAALLLDDVLVVVCRVCKHRMRIGVRALPVPIRSSFSVAQFEERLWCRRCGKRRSAEVVGIEAKGEGKPRALKP